MVRRALSRNAPAHVTLDCGPGCARDRSAYAAVL